MGREVRKVPANWEHPKNEDGSYKPLLEGYNDDKEAFLSMVKQEGLQEAVEYMGCPDKNDYMPDWPESKADHFMMYEDTSEGTPISPAFKTPEELAKWLTDNNASSFANMSATYEQWLSVAKGGWAPSMVISDGKMMSGVEAMSDE